MAKNSSLAFDTSRPPQGALGLKDIPKSDLKYFLSYFRPHLRIFFMDLVCAVFVAAVDLIYPVLSRYTLNTVVPAFKVTPHKTLVTFFVIIGIALALYFFRMLCQYFITYFGHMFGVYVESDMRRDIFFHIEKQSFSFFDKNRTGKIMSRATTDLFEVSELAHHGPEDLLISVLTIAGSFIIMLNIRWQLALVVFIITPLMVLHTSHCKSSIMNTSKGVKVQTSDINTALESSISGARVTKVFTNEEYEQGRFGRSNES